MKKYKITDSLGETIGYITSTAKESEIQQQANKMFAFDKPKIKLCR